ncbi:MAG: EAL domain-containing protein [Ectothiorhodospiraceae bacterium]|nr:EAL domain-containing protein [Chromatiales bacterium]MCP5156988.1 EAL domain-containing protein [Ectothiorhodospiraceae bacterium]
MAEGAPPMVGAGAREGSARAKVVLVEDSPAERDTLRALLERAGHDVLLADDAATALGHIARESVAAVVLDLRLPDRCGLQVLEALAERRPPIRAIVHTGYASLQAAKTSLNLGAFAFVEKGGDPRELLHQIERAVRDFLEETLRSTEQHLEQLVRQVPVGLAYVDDALVVRYANQELARLFGGEEAVVGRAVADLLGGEAGFASQFERRIAAADSERWVEVRCVSLREAGARVLAVTDVTERHRAEQALRISEERYQGLYDSSPDIYFTVDDEGVIGSVNEFGADYLRTSKRDLVGRPFVGLVHDDDRAQVSRQLADAFRHQVVSSALEFRIRRRDGQWLWVQQRARLAAGASGAGELRLVCRDVTEARALSEELSYQASHDSLTGLINRRELENRLARVIETARRDGTEHALCYFDLDQFKIINDTCGHVAGDALLRQLGNVLPARIRRRDTLARMGGDEFAVLIEHCSLEQAMRVARTLLEAIEEFRFTWKERTFSIGASIGLVPIAQESESVAQVLRAADGACYVAKDQGRNRIHLYRPDDVELARRHGEMKWVTRIGRALQEQRFRLAWQPIHATDDAHIGAPEPGARPRWLELLLRMSDDQGRLIPPGAFLPAAERYNIAVRLDRWVVANALEWLAARPDWVDPLEFCTINLSGQSLADDDFLSFVIGLLDDTAFPPEKLCFEVTETAAISDLAGANRFMRALREWGCRFALDDFGSGLSSFAYLKLLPVDFLKIDGLFVRDIADDPIDLAMVRSITDIARVMGKATIAEFVEDARILERVRELGIDFAQGYGLGGPRLLDG